MADTKNKKDIQNERRAQKTARRAKVQKEKKKAKIQNVVMATVVIALVVLAVVLFAYKQIVVSGVVERHTAAVSSENYSVSNSMMTYYFNSLYQSMASYGSSMGLDTSKSLKEQEVYSGTTWYDYLLSQATSQVNQYLVLKEGARAEGFTLDDEAYEEVDEVIDSLKTQASDYGYPSVKSFIKLVYGSCVNIKDIEKCVELMVFAEKYADKLMAEGEYSAEDYDKYFNDNIESYQYADYLKYSFDSTKDETTGEVPAAEAAEMKARSEELAAVTSADEFKAYVKAYLTEKETAALTEGETLDEASIDSTVEGLLVTHATKSSISSSVADAIFNEANPIGFTTTESDDENGSYTVYMKASDIYRDEYTVRSAQTIFISNSSHTDEAGAAAYAQEVLAKWEEGEKTAEAFEALAEEYNEGTHSHGANVVKQSAGSYTDWLYDESRAEGDVEAIASSTDSGVYIVYYAGEGEMAAWEYDVDTALRNEDYSEAYSEFASKYWVYRNEDNLNKISAVSLSSGN